MDQDVVVAKESGSKQENDPKQTQDKPVVRKPGGKSVVLSGHGRSVVLS